MAVFLTKNAPGLRTSPVKRGYWVVRRLLGENIPPPPPNVPELPERRGQARRPDAARDAGPAPRRQEPAPAATSGSTRSAWPSRATARSARRAIATSAAGRSRPRATFPGGSEGTGLDGLRAYHARTSGRTNSSTTSAASCWPTPWAAACCPRTSATIDDMRERAGGRRLPVRQPGRDDRHQPAVPEQTRRRPAREGTPMTMTRRARCSGTRVNCSRRLFLRGVGVTMALPWLESVPVWGADADGGGAGRCPKRFAALFMGNGINPTHWWAKGSGADDGAGHEPRAAGAAQGQDERHQRPVQQDATGVGIHPGQTGNILSGAPLPEGRRAARRHQHGPGARQPPRRGDRAAEHGPGLRAADHRLPRDELLDGLQLAHLLAERRPRRCRWRSIRRWRSTACSTTAAAGAT